MEVDYFTTSFINIQVNIVNGCLQTVRTYKIHVEKGEKWAMCYTDLADIVDDCMVEQSVEYVP